MENTPAHKKDQHQDDPAGQEQVSGEQPAQGRDRRGFFLGLARPGWLGLASGMLVADPLTALVKVVVLVLTIFTVLLSFNPQREIRLLNPAA